MLHPAGEGLWRRDSHPNAFSALSVLSAVTSDFLFRVARVFSGKQLGGFEKSLHMTISGDQERCGVAEADGSERL